MSRPPFARGSVTLVALAIVAVHAAWLTQYGWFRDELYYLSCSKRLAWGYVDHPPLSIALLSLVRAVAGESLAAFRLVAALAGAGTAVLAALIARDFGGRGFAQGLAAAAVGFAPISLGIAHFYSMNALDFAAWAAATLVGLRAIAGGTPRTWLALGVVIGVGLLNKWSVMWLGAGLGAALLLSPNRRVLATPWPWLGAAIAAALFAPHVAWQVRHGWPTLEFIRNASQHKMLGIEALGFAKDYLLILGPGSAPLWLAGLVAAFAPGRPTWRPAGVVWVVTLAILVANGTARTYYLALAAPALFAAGASWWEGRGRAARAVVAFLALAVAAPVLPLAIPCLSPARFVAWQQALGMAPRTEERSRMGVLPQHYADMFGWPEMADSVARVASTLDSAERARAVVLVRNYGEAGALERFGRGRLPSVACLHNNWFYWRPEWNGGTAILVGRDSAEAAELFREVFVGGVAGHPLAMPYERDLPIVIARGFRGDFRKVWDENRHFR